jgi:hypothetical protein
MDKNITYRRKYYDFLTKMNEFCELNNIILENERNIDDFEKYITKYIILVKLAINEINQDNTIENKGLEMANYALDCWDIHFNAFLEPFRSFDKINQIIERVDKIDYSNYIFLD